MPLSMSSNSLSISGRSSGRNVPDSPRSAKYGSKSSSFQWGSRPFFPVAHAKRSSVCISLDWLLSVSFFFARSSERLAYTAALRLMRRVGGTHSGQLSACAVCSIFLIGLLLLSGHEKINEKTGQEFVAVNVRPFSSLRQNTRWCGCTARLQHSIRVGLL